MHNTYHKLLEDLNPCYSILFYCFLNMQIKDEYHSNILKWIPAKLPETVRVVVSLSPNGETRKVNICVRWF